LVVFLHDLAGFSRVRTECSQEVPGFEWSEFAFSPARRVWSLCRVRLNRERLVKAWTAFYFPISTSYFPAQKWAFPAFYYRLLTRAAR